MPGAREAAAVAPPDDLQSALFAKLRPGPGMPAAEVADHQRARIRSEAATRIAELDCALRRESLTDLPAVWNGNAGDGDDPGAPAGDAGLLLSAAAKLAAAEGYGTLTVQRILAAAGAPRRSFFASFDTVEDCFVAAVALQAEAALAEAKRARATSSTWAGGIYRMVTALCAHVARDPVLAALCFGDAVAPGEGGIRCREQLIADIADLCMDGAPSREHRDESAFHASAAAAWSVIHDEVIAERARQLPQIAATLAYLILTPAVGVRGFNEGMRDGQALAVSAA